MKIFTLVLFGVLLAVAGLFVVLRKQRRDSILEEGRRSSVALASAGEQVEFRWEYESCPAGNPGVYAEWTRRLADAKASAARADEEFGATDPGVEFLGAAISNQLILMEERRVKCLKRQEEYLDLLAGRRSSR